MKFPIVRASNLINAVIIVIALCISGLLMLFGIANLISPDVADEYRMQNTIACVVVCGIGVAALVLAIAAVRGILYKD